MHPRQVPFTLSFHVIVENVRKAEAGDVDLSCVHPPRSRGHLGGKLPEAEKRSEQSIPVMRWIPSYENVTRPPLFVHPTGFTTSSNR